jgi:DNA-directed RNA polymerase subunit M/transcription elongation factor TFIIS
MMSFCNYCENMMYTKLDKDKLIFYCKNCGHAEEQYNKKSLLIAEKKYNGSGNEEIDYDIFLSKDIKHDKKIPRVNNITCPNTKCSKTAKEPNEVMYIKYDNNEMKYMYQCVYCEYTWRV